MIRLTGHDGSAHLVNSAGILSVTEAGVSAAWHGVRSYVKLIDGSTIEARETVEAIARAATPADGEGRVPSSTSDRT